MTLEIIVWATTKIATGIRRVMNWTEWNFRQGYGGRRMEGYCFDEGYGRRGLEECVTRI